MATLEREMREETAWTIADPRLIGFMHFHHLTPKPLGYAYPYPDFLQVVYVVRAAAPLPGAEIEDEWVDDVFFSPVDELEAYAIDAGQQRFLQEALSVHQGL
jgi:8-oxo-dGTP pyrophosphatase MutT (NUDIX family)